MKTPGRAQDNTNKKPPQLGHTTVTRTAVPLAAGGAADESEPAEHTAAAATAAADGDDCALADEEKVAVAEEEHTVASADGACVESHADVVTGESAGAPLVAAGAREVTE